ncbi:unnamed protein product, partial [marine sediment metagenome]
MGTEAEEFEFALALKRKRAQAAPAPAQEPAPVETPAPAPVSNVMYPPAENPTAMQKMGHVGTALGRVAFGIADLPSLVGDAAGWGINKFMDQDKVGDEVANLIPSTDEIPWLQKTKHFLTDPMIDPKKHKGVDAAKTALEWGVPLPVA